eukprot:1157855-Pelagomonas_calceolata.AAC.4
MDRSRKKPVSGMPKTLRGMSHHMHTFAMCAQVQFWNISTDRHKGQNEHAYHPNTHELQTAQAQ